MNLLSKILCAAAVVASLSGCASSDRRWEHKAPMAADSFAGKWEGRWTSAKHHHSSGRLQCVLTPVAREVREKPGTSHYVAHFKAQWLAFSSSYDVRLEAQRRHGELRFHGTHELPAIFGGTYTFDESATSERFFSRYASSYDHGTFQMIRPHETGR